MISEQQNNQASIGNDKITIPFPNIFCGLGIFSVGDMPVSAIVEVISELPAKIASAVMSMVPLIKGIGTVMFIKI